MNVEALQRRIAELTNEIKGLKKQKKFGLVWEDKPDAQVMRVRDEAPMLREDASKAIVTDQNAANHILINGDNFHALTALRATHTGKVDVIYIDPPYNTGHKDFIYNDSYLDKEDGYRHSKWLAFMEKRLVLAQELLSESGVLFVSIDDNEQARLKLLMDEIFGPDNFVTTLSVSYNPKGRSTTKFFADNHEYVLVYTKSISKTYLKPESKDLVNPNEYNLTDERGKYRLLRFLNTSKQFTPKNRPNLAYPVYINANSKSVSLVRTAPSDIEVYPTFVTGEAAVWRWGKDKFAEDNWKLVGHKIKDVWTVKRKDHLTEDKAMTLKTHLNYELLGSSDEANKLITKILGQKKFNYPKNIKGIKLLISLMPKDSLVLDFFAGSGTTAHAVAELNNEDGGTRQCILVTDGGKTETSGESSKNTKDGAVNIAEEVTYERVRRTLTGKDWADGKEHEPLGGNLRYFKVELEPTPHDITELDQRTVLEKYTVEHAKLATNVFSEVSSKQETGEGTLRVDYRMYSDGTNARYLVGVNAHDSALVDLEEWFKALPELAIVVMVGSGLQDIEWIKQNSDRITVDDVLGRVIRSRKHVASKL